MDPKKTKKKPELIEQLFIGNYIDVHHQQTKCYKLAYILSKNDKEIEVTYDGLTKKENEVNYIYTISASNLHPIESTLQDASHKVCQFLLL